MTGLSETEYADLLALWLTRTPLTDLATIDRQRPAFAWSASTLALVATPPGRILAQRAFARLPEHAVISALEKAAAGVHPKLEEARRLAEAMLAAARPEEAEAAP